MKKKVGYTGLVGEVLDVPEKDILPLRERDIKMIDEIVDNLPSQKGKSVRLYFGLEERAHTYREAAEKLGVTAPAVRVHTVGALRMLKHPSRTRHLARLVRSLLEKQLDDQAVKIVELESKVAELVTALVAKGYKVKDLTELLTKSVDELDLTVRASCSLRNANIKTIGELVQKTEMDMLRMKNFGRRSLNEFKEVLQGMGLRFGMKV